MSVTTVDYLVIGSGLTGSTIARRLADAGREVLILERRGHVGGNVHDFLHHSGVRVHSYGPHYFRCSSPRIWEFATRFCEFQRSEARVKVLVGGVFEDWPVNRRIFQRYPGWSPTSSKQKPGNFEAACLCKLPREVYQTFVENYTRKQWGAEPRCLGPELARRIRVNSGSRYLLKSRFHQQALPVRGYADWMKTMINGIPCLTGVDYLQRRDEFQARKLLISTGSVDEFFGFDEGRLAYRAQRRRQEFFPDRVFLQPCVQVNYPGSDESEPIRTIEWKHLLPTEQQKRVAGTLVTHEYPFSPTKPNEFEYPFPDSSNRALYRRYRIRARQVPKLLVCGRLGDYCYYDMDHAIGRALTLADRILDRDS
jgi:UDP-galactopyranose mutase